MIGYYNYTVVLTYIGLISGVFGIYSALHNSPMDAVLFLMICGICDMFDGTIARTCKTRTDDEKAFGIQIDSLCDLVCFGILPVIIGLSIGVERLICVLSLAFYALAAVIRLAFYNVQEINRTQKSNEARKYYIGLPVTSIAIILPTVLLIGSFIHIQAVKLYTLCLLVVGIAFISNFKVKKMSFPVMIACAVFGVVIFFMFIKFGGNIVW